MRGPLVAIVGRPNVGKSTLFNRLVGGRPALVHDTAGLTRDRRYGEVEYFGHVFRVVDTGGLDPAAEKEEVGAGIHRQAHAALGEADLVVLVVDARAGANPLDAEVAQLLRKSGKSVLMAANKADSPKRDDQLADFYSLGVGTPMPISAEHGRGIDDLVQAVVDALGPAAEAPTPATAEVDEGDSIDRPLRIALVGKPNAGKSSILNRLVGTERALVHHVPGTTTDPIDTDVEIGGRKFTIVDTAGIRRRARVDEDIERIAASVALGQIRRSDVTILVIDGSLGPSSQDARLASMVQEAGRGLVVALNKADLLSTAEATASLRAKREDELRFVKYAPTQMLSAARGDGVLDLIDRVCEVAEQHSRRIATPELNRFFAEVCQTHPPPTRGSKTVTIHYLTQGGVRPPTFLLWANRPEIIEPAYRRFVVNQLRARYGFSGTPLRVVIKRKAGRDKRPARPKRRGMGSRRGGRSKRR